MSGEHRSAVRDFSHVLFLIDICDIEAKNVPQDYVLRKNVAKDDSSDKIVHLGCCGSGSGSESKSDERSYSCSGPLQPEAHAHTCTCTPTHTDTGIDTDTQMNDDVVEYTPADRVDDITLSLSRSLPLPLHLQISTLMHRAYCYRKLGNFNQTMCGCTRVILLDPHNIQVHLQHCTILHNN